MEILCLQDSSWLHSVSHHWGQEIDRRELSQGKLSIPDCIVMSAVVVYGLFVAFFFPTESPNTDQSAVDTEDGAQTAGGFSGAVDTRAC